VSDDSFNKEWSVKSGDLILTIDSHGIALFARKTCLREDQYKSVICNLGYDDQTKATNICSRTNPLLKPPDRDINTIPNSPPTHWDLAKPSDRYINTNKQCSLLSSSIKGLCPTRTWDIHSLLKLSSDTDNKQQCSQTWDSGKKPTTICNKYEPPQLDSTRQPSPRDTGLNCPFTNPLPSISLPTIRLCSQQQCKNQSNLSDLCSQQQQCKIQSNESPKPPSTCSQSVKFLISQNEENPTKSTCFFTRQTQNLCHLFSQQISSSTDTNNNTSKSDDDSQNEHFMDHEEDDRKKKQKI